MFSGHGSEVFGRSILRVDIAIGMTVDELGENIREISERIEVIARLGGRQLDVVGAGRRFSFLPAAPRFYRACSSSASPLNQLCALPVKDK